MRRERAQRADGAASPALAVEHLGEQLEVREHARQRRAQLVRGVGDELRAGARASPRSPRARASSAREHAVQRARQLGDLVVGAGAGARAWRGRGCCAISRAVAVSAAIGAIARRAIHSPASERQQRSRRARRARRKKPHARDRRSMSETGRAYWTISGTERRVLRPVGVRISIWRSRVSTR